MLLSARKLVIPFILGAIAGCFQQAFADSDEIICDEEHDFIVAGSGPEGSVVASRLAQAGFRTLALDAGPDCDGIDTQTPATWPLTTINPQLEWAFRVKTNQNAGALYPRSSNIGGCAKHNAMQAAHPRPALFANLAALASDEELAEDKMRQRFINVKKNECAPPPDTSLGHGSNGVTSISFGDQPLVADDDQQLARHRLRPSWQRAALLLQAHFLSLFHPLASMRHSIQTLMPSA